MNENSKCRLLEKIPGERAVKDELPYETPVVKAGRLGRGLAVSAIAVTLLISTCGCAPEDILPPLNGDIPFEQSQNTADDMEDMEKPLTEPDENAFYTEGAGEDPTE